MSNKLVTALSLVFDVMAIIFLFISMFLMKGNNIYLVLAFICIIVANIFNIIRNKNNNKTI